MNKYTQKIFLSKIFNRNQLTIIKNNIKIYIRDKHIGNLLLPIRGSMCAIHRVYYIYGVFVLIKGV